MKLYKDGNECDCHKDQFVDMAKAGWSKTKSEPKKDPVDNSAQLKQATKQTKPLKQTAQNN